MNRILWLVMLLALRPGLLLAAPAQSTAFTYQGRLMLADGHPANGNYDMTFKLFDTGTVGTGTQVGSTITLTQFPVVNGLFTTDLDFPGAFTGNQLWLEVAVDNETLDKRQPVDSVPVAQYALAAPAPPPAPVFLSSARSLQVSTGPGGTPAMMAVMPLSGHVDSAYSMPYAGPIVDLTPVTGAPPPQVLPTDGTVGSIRASFIASAAPFIPDTVTLSAQLYTSVGPITVLVPVPGASCQMVLGGGVVAGQVLQCTQTGLSIPYVAGTNAAIVVAATSVVFVDSLTGSMSVSVGP